jgi:hypothetical protein
MTLATCLESDAGDDLTVVDEGIPLSGELFHYLIRAENVCPSGVGSLGSSSGGVPHVGRSCP